MSVYTYKNPVLKNGVHKVTSKYGMRTITINGVTKTAMHNGIDLVGVSGGKSALDYIIAFADGVVTISKYSATAGEYVQIDHGNGQYTRYLHLKKGSRTVKVGQAVKKGDVLGYMGATGNVTGAHLHFDIQVNGKYVDPEPYLKGEKGFEVAKENAVLEWQLAAIKDGFKFPKYGADGKWGAECVEVAKKAVCKKRLTYKYKNLTKIVQRTVKVTVDGKYGNGTHSAVIKWQKSNGLTADGCVGLNTWKKILKV